MRITCKTGDAAKVALSGLKQVNSDMEIISKHLRTAMAANTPSKSAVETLQIALNNSTKAFKDLSGVALKLTLVDGTVELTDEETSLLAYAANSERNNIVRSGD